MKTVGVHGGAGFIGQYTVRELLSRGYDVLVMDRVAKEIPEGAEFFLGDIQDPVAVTEFAAHVDGVIALGGTLGTAETINNPLPAAKTNIIGGLNTLEAVSQYNIPLVQIAVGNHFEFSTYSITKTTVERFCVMYRKYRGTKATVVRAMNAVGPGQSVAAPYGNSKVRKLVPSIACRALAGDSIEIYGDGNSVMDFIHARDIARTLVDALEYTDKNGAIEHVLECGLGNDSTVNDVVKIVTDLVPGSAENVKHIPMRLGESDHSVVKADVTTLDVLGENYAGSFTSLEDSLAEAVNYFDQYLDNR
jgi:UDP-glucose 4-epimerase